MSIIKNTQLIFHFYPRKIWRSLKNLPWYFRTKKAFRQQSQKSSNPFGKIISYPCLLDRDEEGGDAKSHYFHQDLLVAQKVFQANPLKHLDIGSRISGLIAHLASFREVIVLDIRKVTPTIKNVTFIQADCMNLDASWDNSYQSISSLHALEHFGIGRYGDPIDINGHLKGLDNIYRMLVQGGIFYFSVPIGEQRIEFNAHRVFSIQYLLDYFKDKYTIQSVSYVDDAGDLHPDIKLSDGNIKDNFGCNYGCGIFELQKR